MNGTEIAVVEDADVLVNVETGELLPATVENAAAVLLAARTMKQRIRNIEAAVAAYVVGEAAHRGTKTLHSQHGTVTLTGGAATEYDAVDLMEALRVAGCPEDRIDAVVVAEVSYKVNRLVLRQLVAANPDYLAAAQLAERTVEKPYRASVSV